MFAKAILIYQLLHGNSWLSMALLSLQLSQSSAASSHRRRNGSLY